MIKPESIDKLRQISLVDAVKDYDIALKKSGTNFKANSPWGADKTPSFFVNPVKNIFKDFSTGKGGTGAINFVMQKENCEFLEACKILAGKHGITLEYDREQKPPDPTRVAVKEVLGWALSHFAATDLPEPFLKARNLPESICDRFQLGYAPPGWDGLIKAAKQAGIPMDILLKAGLIKKREGKPGYYDTFRDRVIIPVVDYQGKVVGFSGRDAETVKKPKEQHNPKYCHTEGMEKSKHLYGLFQAIAGGQLEAGAYLVEGPFDVQRFHVYNVTNVVGLQGTDFSEEQARLLKRFTNKITFVPDNDTEAEKKLGRNPGIEGMKKNVPMALQFGFAVKFLIPGQ